MRVVSEAEMCICAGSVVCMKVPFTTKGIITRLLVISFAKSKAVTFQILCNYI